MNLLSRLQSVRDKLKTKKIKTKTLGEVELMPLFVSQRNKLNSSEVREGSQDFILLFIAMSLAENGVRIIDSIDLEEVIATLDPVGSTKEGLEDIYDLYTEANKLSKVTVADVEEAEKN